MKFNISCGHHKKPTNRTSVIDAHQNDVPKSCEKSLNAELLIKETGASGVFWVWLGGCDKMGKVKSSNHYQQHAEEKCKSVA